MSTPTTFSVPCPHLVCRGWGGARRAVPPPPRRRRRGAPRAGGRAGHHRQPAHGRAGGGPPAARARGGGAGDGALRDAAGQPDADRLRRVRGDARGERVRVHLFVATLGYSRRVHVRAFRHERQSAWFEGVEGAFAHFGGVPAELLLDNARALVEPHDAGTREVVFNARFHAFARYWGVRPVA